MKKGRLPIRETFPNLIRDGGKALRRVRLQAGLTQAALSRMTGVYHNDIWKMEAGVYGAATRNRREFNPSALKLARALKTTPAAIWPMYIELFAATKEAAAVRKQEATDQRKSTQARLKRREDKRKLIGRLEKKHREVLSAKQKETALLYAGGKSLSQIAKIQGVTKQAVHSILSTVLKRNE
jgi:transcriptional regulator with XRE-family HTH domain